MRNSTECLRIWNGSSDPVSLPASAQLGNLVLEQSPGAVDLEGVVAPSLLDAPLVELVEQQKVVDVDRRELLVSHGAVSR